jgi:hypothetical protein
LHVADGVQNAGGLPRVSFRADAGNSCAFFSSADCRLSIRDGDVSTITAANSTTVAMIDDLYRTRGDSTDKIVRSFICSPKGTSDAYKHARALLA